MGTEVLKNLSPALEKLNRTLESSKNSELYSDIPDSHTQGEVMPYPFILKGEKIKLFLISAIKKMLEIYRVGLISYK